MSHKYDVIISGAGPSGSLLAYLLASNNIKTLVLEKKSFPRSKICAGGLQHRASELIPFSIEKVIEKKIYGIYFSYKSNNIFNRSYDDPLIYTVDRAKLDQFIAKKAQEAGSDFCYSCPVTDFEAGNRSIEVKTPEKIFEGKLLVGADGSRGTVHKRLVSFKQLFKIVGYEFELNRDQIDGALDLDHNIAIDFGGIKKGYAWVFPKLEKLSIGIGGPHYRAKQIKKYFKNFISSYAIFKGGGYSPKVYGQYIPVRKPNAPLSSYRVIMTGDAAGLGDAFTGEGFFNCFKSSLLAAKSITRALARGTYFFEDYHKMISDTVYRDIKISMLFSRLFFLSPFLMYNILLKNDKIFKTCCQVLRGNRSYKELARKVKLFKY